MSGIELVLAITPLVISAAEHRKKIVKVVKAVASASAKEEQELSFYYDLYDELSLLANTLAGILLGLPHPVDPKQSTKLDSSHRQAIDDVLGQNAQAFHNILDRMLKSIDDLVSDKSLGLNQSDVSLHSSGAFCVKLQYFKDAIERGEATSTLQERFLFTRNAKSRSVAMQRIQNGNLKLERLLHGVLSLDKLETFQAEKNKPYPTRFRRISEPLFKKMAEKWPKTCTNHAQHEARLCLWNCCSKDRSSRKSDSVDMVMSVTDLDRDGAPWQESLILIPDGEQNPSPPQTAIRFVIDGQTLPSVGNLSTPHRDIDAEPLCNLISQAYGHRATLQMIFNQGKLWQARSRRMSLDIKKQRDVTLKDLLQSPARNFSLREKWTLAVILAHAALHCSNGPWLEQDWSKEHICFFKTDQSMKPDLGRPFLKILFHDKPDQGPVEVDTFALHSNPSLLSLGILLLEIYLAHPIESKWSEDDLTDGVQNENTNLTTALRLLQDSEGELYEGYRAAIKACLTCEAPILNAEEFAKTVYHNIVQPLETELKHGFHVTVEDFQLAGDTGR